MGWFGVWGGEGSLGNYETGRGAEGVEGMQVAPWMERGQGKEYCHERDGRHTRGRQKPWPWGGFSEGLASQAGHRRISWACAPKER